MWRGRRRPQHARRGSRHPLKDGASIVVAMLREGRTYAQIAEVFGVSPQAVWKFADETGVRPGLARTRRVA